MSVRATLRLVLLASIILDWVVVSSYLHEPVVAESPSACEAEADREVDLEGIASTWLSTESLLGQFDELSYANLANEQALLPAVYAHSLKHLRGPPAV